MRVWRADCARCFGSRNFLVAVSSVLVLLFFSISAEPFFPASLEWKSVYDFFSEIFIGMPVRMSLLICSIPYGLSLCEDMEYRYVYPVLSRQSIGTFLFRRMTVIFWSSWLVMVLALLFCVLILHHWAPWCDVSDTNYIISVAENGWFYDALMKKNGFLFFVVYSMEFAMLPGTLSVLAAGVSVWITDRLLTLSIPFLVVYVTLDLSVAKGISFLNIFQYYDVLGCTVENDFYIICKGILLTSSIFLMTYFVSCIGLKRRLANG